MQAYTLLQQLKNDGLTTQKPNYDLSGADRYMLQMIAQAIGCQHVNFRVQPDNKFGSLEAFPLLESLNLGLPVKSIYGWLEPQSALQEQTKIKVELSKNILKYLKVSEGIERYRKVSKGIEGIETTKGIDAKSKVVLASIPLVVSIPSIP